MNRNILFLFACGLSGLTTAAQSGRTPYLTKTFPRESIKQLETATSGGNISVSGVTSGEAKVEIYITANNGRWDEISKEEIQKRLDEQFNLNVALSGDKLMATARPKERNMNWRRSLSISFKIYVPVTVSSQIATSGGNVSLKDLSGTEDFRTSGGNLDIDHVSGKLTGRTSGGNVSVTGSREDIDLTTSGGNIDAENCEGTIRLSTSGGNLNLRALKGTIHATTSGGQVEGEAISGELQTRTSGGNIDLRDLSCSLRGSTSGGSIDVRIKTLGKYVDLENSSGNISLELPQGQGLNLKIHGERVHTGTLNSFSGQMDERHIDGALGGGGIPVTVDGNSGSVHLSFR
jgi:DUF4097 and DUF4098 domain-containing protein YvlB